ncbi:uncharacterized protein LOC133831817 [Humulus lupulus]|uniref:uncharacterized protein LOC133831817 n=1 Tax=Humulus lupulus TaxID=3486 RepID=UPI002B408B07|nr:uncharacterized protein LOC133831817 [Humulus lupulus]
MPPLRQTPSSSPLRLTPSLPSFSFFSPFSLSLSLPWPSSSNGVVGSPIPPPVGPHLALRSCFPAWKPLPSPLSPTQLTPIASSLAVVPHPLFRTATIGSLNVTSLALTLSTHSSNPFALRPTHTPTTASFNSSRLPNSAALTFSGDPLKNRARARGLSVVTRAGPSTGSFVLAFFLPLSLILVTVFASIRISDKLDRDYLEEFSFTFCEF